MVEPTCDLDTAMKMIMDDLHTHKWTVFVETGPGKFSAHASLDYIEYYLKHGGSLIFFIEEKMALVVNYDSVDDVFVYQVFFTKEELRKFIEDVMNYPVCW